VREKLEMNDITYVHTVQKKTITNSLQEAGAITRAGLYKPPALPLALALCSRVTEEQEKRWNTDEEHS
jgi:hypothetical protein